MVARGEQRPALAPGVGRRIVFLDGREHVVRAGRVDAGLGCARERVGAADHVNLAVDGGGARGAALGRHGRERFPAVGRRIVFPRVVERAPRGRPVVRQGEAAERVDFVVKRGEGDVVRGQLHRLLARPVVGRGVVFVDQRLGGPVGAEAAENVELAVRDRAEHLLRGIRKRRERRPRVGRRRRGGRLRKRVGERDCCRHCPRADDDASRRHAVPPSYCRCAAS